MSNKTFERYISKNNEINKKFLAQINLQMLATKLTKGYFCVAHPYFETTRECTVIEISYDPEFIQCIIDYLFLENHVFPLLHDSLK